MSACTHIRTITGRRLQGCLIITLTLGKRELLLWLMPGLSCCSVAFIPGPWLKCSVLCYLWTWWCRGWYYITGKCPLSLGMCEAQRTVLYGWRLIGLINESHSLSSPSLIIRASDIRDGLRQSQMMPRDSRELSVTSLFILRSDLVG